MPDEDIVIRVIRPGEDPDTTGLKKGMPEATPPSAAACSPLKADNALPAATASGSSGSGLNVAAPASVAVVGADNSASSSSAGVPEAEASVSAAERWKPVPVTQPIVLCGLAGYALYQLFNGAQGVFPLDQLNLLLHETGHLATRSLGERWAPYTGALGQLFFPAVIAATASIKRDTFVFAACMVWFFENFINIGTYMSDAAVRKLPLVFGTKHDFTEIFGRWNILGHSTEIGMAFRVVGMSGMAISALWLFLIWSEQRRAEKR